MYILRNIINLNNQCDDPERWFIKRNLMKNTNIAVI